MHLGSVGELPEPAPRIGGLPTRASTKDRWGTITGINPGVTISAVPPELFAQCGLNARGMTDFVTRGLQPRGWRCYESWCRLWGPAPSHGAGSGEMLRSMVQALGGLLRVMVLAAGTCSWSWCRLRGDAPRQHRAPGDLLWGRDQADSGRLLVSGLGSVGHQHRSLHQRL